jgi:hypothetical protein
MELAPLTTAAPLSGTAGSFCQQPTYLAADARPRADVGAAQEVIVVREVKRATAGCELKRPG